MGLLLDPREPVEHRIEDVVFYVTVLPQRAKVRFLKALQPIQARFKDFEAEDGKVEIPVDEMPDVMDGLADVLLVGLAGYKQDECVREDITGETLDRIPFDRWSELFNVICEVNLATEQDAKN